jgi:peptide/nickel transport system substrate-binding protein
MFSAPVSRAVQPSDIKFSIERLFRIDSGGVGFYTGIVGAEQYAKTRKGGIRGIVADDKAHTIAFHLTAPDGTFLDYMAVPFAFALPKGTPDKDISTIAKWRVATGPYGISGYTPKDSIEITRNPTFKSWTKDTPDGHLDGIHVALGVTPDQAVTEIANDQLDWYFEPVAPARLTELKARYPKQVFDFTRNNVTYFTMNSRKAPFDKLAVRQAVNYATNRSALVKLFGGQGTVTESILPPGMGSAYKKHDFYPYNLAKAKTLVASSGTKGMAVTVWSHTTDPTPKAAQYMASVLDELGYKASVKTLDESVYWDTIATQKGDPQIAFQDWNQDFPEGQDFIDVLLNGKNITNIGNNNQSNTNVPAINKRIDAAKQMPLGPKRNALWAAIDAEAMKTNAPWVPFMNRQIPKFVSARVHGLVFNITYYELLPSLWLAK